MASSQEYAPEAVEKRTSQGMKLLESLRENFGDDEFSVEQVREAMEGGELRELQEKPSSEKTHSETAMREMMEGLQKEGVIESVERDGKTLYRFTLDGIRVLETSRTS